MRRQHLPSPLPHPGCLGLQMLKPEGCFTLQTIGRLMGRDGAEQACGWVQLGGCWEGVRACAGVVGSWV